MQEYILPIFVLGFLSGATVFCFSYWLVFTKLVKRKDMVNYLFTDAEKMHIYESVGSRWKRFLTTKNETTRDDIIMLQNLQKDFKNHDKELRY